MPSTSRILVFVGLIAAASHCSGRFGDVPTAIPRDDAAVATGVGPSLPGGDDVASSPPDAGRVSDTRLDATADSATRDATTTDATVPDASTDSGVFDDAPPEWDGAIPPLRGPYERWANWPMPNPASAGLPNPQTYDTSTPGVVRDLVTGLEWQAQGHDGFDWPDAVDYCQSLTLDGESDWRVPSRIELVSIYDSTREQPGFASVFSMPPDYAPNALPYVWTSSRSSMDPSSVWAGGVWWESMGAGSDPSLPSQYAWCVRGGPATDVLPPARYAVASGVVHDTMTGLAWQQPGSDAPLSWSDAVSYCASLGSDADADGGAWRLPSFNELQTLIDETANPWNPDSGPPTGLIVVADLTAMIDGTAFPNTAKYEYWTSAVLDDEYRGAVEFTIGSAESYSTTKDSHGGPYPPGEAFVRCVK